MSGHSKPEPITSRSGEDNFFTSKFLRTVPEKTGVYLMLDAGGRIIYVGKAADLKKRLASYGRAAKESSGKTTLLVEQVCQIETILTNTEQEALILEAALIKKHKPKYNISLRDDKTYPMIKVTVGDEWPRVIMTRRRLRDQARYFGPYSSAVAMWKTLHMLQRLFPLRRCKGKKPLPRSRPCLNFQIGLCLAPCVGKVEIEKYQEMVREVIMVLEGKNKELVHRFEKNMKQAAASLDFEEAAVYRDRIAALESTLEKQVVASDHYRNQDVFGLVHKEGIVCLSIVAVREGRVCGLQAFSPADPVGTDAEILAEAVKRYYADGQNMPDDIVLPFAIDEMEALAEWISAIHGARVNFRIPQRGDLVRLVQLARDNAEQVLAERRQRSDDWDKLAENMRRKLYMKGLPERIECYDISTIGGQQSVGARVSFLRGEPDKTSYRSYKIRSIQGLDDYGMMAEVLERRLQGCKDSELPDLILLDGGKGQLNVALRALAEHGLHERIAAVGIAKERAEEGEKIYLANRKNPLHLPRHSSVLLLLMRIRDEAHRFGITFHRKLRQKEIVRSELDGIPGIGPERKKRLLSLLGSLQSVKKASVDELAAVPGIGRSRAGVIWNWLHGKQNSPQRTRSAQRDFFKKT